MTDTFASGPAPTFASRHIGLRPEDEGKMLADLAGEDRVLLIITPAKPQAEWSARGF